MDLRCPACRQPASEWAARCPSCRADLSGAEPIPAPPAARRRPRLHLRPDRRGRAGLLAVAVVVAAGLGTALLRDRPPGSPPPVAAAPVIPPTASPTTAPPTTASPSTTAPASSSVTAGAGTGGGQLHPSPGRAAAGRLAAQELFVAEGSTTELVGADGTVLRRIDSPAGPSAAPVAMSASIVAYLSGGRAYAFDVATETGPAPIGPAQAIFSAGLQGVILVDRSGTRQRITTVDADLTSDTSYTIPGSDRVVAGSASGLLIETGSHALALVSAGHAGPRTVTGPVTRVVAFSGDEVAWTSQAGCQLELTTDCPLHLTDVRTHADRLVVVPGAIGFAGIGAFSPDGRSLAVYELSDRPQRISGLDLVVVPTVAGAARRIATVLDAGSFTPTVTWSPTGEWLFFGASGSFAAVDFAPPGAGPVSDQPVPLPLSVRCCVVGY